MTEARAREAGLTLVELLVVLALLGLLGGLAAAGLSSASTSWQRIVRRDADNERLLALDRMLRQLLSEIVPQQIGGYLNGTVRFSGASDRIEFLAPLARRFGAEDIVVYTVDFPGDGTLRMSWRLDRESPSGRKSFAPPAAEEVFSGLSEATFAYFGQSAENGEARWQDNWKERVSLPSLLRVRFLWNGQPENVIVAPLRTAGPCSIPDSDLPCSN
jgi:general secretion pathway protein J